MGTFFKMVIDYKKKIGFSGQLLIEPKPKEPMKHQYDYGEWWCHTSCPHFLCQHLPHLVSPLPMPTPATPPVPTSYANTCHTSCPHFLCQHLPHLLSPLPMPTPATPPVPTSYANTCHTFCPHFLCQHLPHLLSPLPMPTPATPPVPTSYANTCHTSCPHFLCQHLPHLLPSQWGRTVWQGIGIGSRDRRCGRCWHRKWGQKVWQGVEGYGEASFPTPMFLKNILVRILAQIF